MHKQEDRQSQIQNRCTTVSSLSWLIGNILKKFSLTIKSIYTYWKLKIFYRNRIKMYALNSVKGRIKITLFQGANLSIGRFLMTAGPCYIKCVDNAYCEIGNNVFMNHNCSITCADRIIIGDYCNIANNVVIVDHDHRLGEKGVINGLETEEVIIGKNVWIGANVTILKGTHIGAGAVIAAGAVVNKDIPSYEVWGGIPAKKIRSL